VTIEIAMEYSFDLFFIQWISKYTYTHTLHSNRIRKRIKKKQNVIKSRSEKMSVWNKII